MFRLDPRLEADSFLIKELQLCQLRLMNDQTYPWLILVPHVADICEIIDLSQEDQLQLMREIASVSRVFKNFTNAHKLNIAALGNMVPQLHVHIIARFTYDVAWPAPIWGKAPVKPYVETNFLLKLKQMAWV